VPSNPNSQTDPTETNNVPPADPTQVLTAAPAALAKASSGDRKSEDSSSSNGTATADPATAAAPSAAADPPQPPAAAVTVAPVSPPTPVNIVSTTTATIGDAIKRQTRPATATVTAQHGPPTSDTSDAAPADQPSAPVTTDGGGDKLASSAAVTEGKTQAPSDVIQQTQPQAQASDSNPVASSSPTDTAALASADHANVRATDGSAMSASLTAATANTQSGVGAAKADVAGVPNLGFTALAATTSSAAAGSTASGAASTADPVPVAGLAVAIAARAQSGSNQFDISLDPPELGRIDVRLDVDSTGQVTTHMTADRPDTLQLLQSQQPQIEQALQDAGLKTADNGLQFTLRDQSFTGGQNSGSGSQTDNPAQVVIPDADLTPVAATQIYARGGLGSGIDIRV
jgi:flagellar hook-length control protein FliK